MHVTSKLVLHLHVSLSTCELNHSLKPSTTSSLTHAYLCEDSKIHVCMSTIASIHMCQQCVQSTQERLRLHATTCRLYMCARHKRQCCIDKQQKVWYMSACMLVSTCVVDLYQIVRTKSSASLNHGYVMHVSIDEYTDKYMHVSRTSDFVHISLYM